MAATSTRNALPILGLLALSLMNATPAQSRVIVGNGSGSVMTFADGANGNATPVKTISPGASNPIQSATAIEFDNNELFVSDFSGQAIRVYDVNANGSVAPLRTMTSSWLGQPRVVRIDRKRDEMVVIAGMIRICSWPRLSNGDLYPTRCVPWGQTMGSTSQLNNPAGLALNRVREEMVVGDYAPAQPFANRILIFDRMADVFNPTPLRIIEGANTRLGQGTNVYTVVDEASQLIFAACGESNPDGTISARILMFPADAGGNVSPLHVIEGAGAGLRLPVGHYVGGLGFDEDNQMLLLTIQSNDSSGQGRVLAFGKWSSADVPPVYTLTGAQTGLGDYPGTVGATTVKIFRDGLE
jgi:hypothetical protein